MQLLKRYYKEYPIYYIRLLYKEEERERKRGYKL